MTEYGVDVTLNICFSYNTIQETLEKLKENVLSHLNIDSVELKLSNGRKMILNIDDIQVNIDNIRDLSDDEE